MSSLRTSTNKTFERPDNWSSELPPEQRVVILRAIKRKFYNLPTFLLRLKIIIEIIISI